MQLHSYLQTWWLVTNFINRSIDRFTEEDIKYYIVGMLAVGIGQIVCKLINF